MELVNLITCQELDKLVEETYKRPYCYQQQDGCKSRGCFKISVPDYEDDYENSVISENIKHDQMGVSFKAWLERDPQQLLANNESKSDLLLWWERNFYPSITMVLNDLHKKGLIPAGKICIVIDW